MNSDEYGIPVIECHSAEQMMAELNEIHSRWKDGTWIFRGQNDECWKLHPKAMRTNLIIEQVVKNVVHKSFEKILTDNTDKLENWD